MRKIILLAVMVALCATANAQTIEITPPLAEVQQIQGYWVFVKSKPVSKYEYLGTVKGPAISKSDFDVLLPKMLEKVKEEYPQANGVIFSGDMGPSEKYRVDAIKF